MEYKLLTVSKFPNISGVNIGDYIQALASSQFLPHIDGYIDRDEDLKDYNGQPCKVIMNGWYMHNPDNWPPSTLIDPLFVAFHINSRVKGKLLSQSSLKYLKEHQPIGCRDINTMNILKENNIDAYFSGCMTLTLGEKYRASKRANLTYIVDPIFNGRLSFSNVCKAVSVLLGHPYDILKLCRTKQLRLHYGRNFISKILKTSLYYREYSRIFGREMIMTSIYVTQEDMSYKTRFSTEQERLKEAESLVKQYSQASLVVTSRIHCALPCLGLETPVIYIEKGGDIEESTCRLGGLRNLFNIVKIDNGILSPQFETSLPINMNNHPDNKDSWKKLAYSLKQKCISFISESSK